MLSTNSILTILPSLTFVAGALTLKALQQNWYKEVIMTNYIGNGCFSEARRDSYDGLITQTGIFL